MTVTQIPAIEAPLALDRTSALGQLPMPQAPGSGGFADLLAKGLDGVSTKVTDADKMVRDFALDDSIPVHQVTYALEQARLSLELAMQVRSRLLEAYQQLMNMQL